MYSLTELLGQPVTNMVEKPVAVKSDKVVNHSLKPKDRASDFIVNTLLPLEGGATEHAMEGEEGTTKFGIRSKYYNDKILKKPLSDITKEDAIEYYKQTKYSKELDDIDSDAIAYRIFDQKVQAPAKVVENVRNALVKLGIQPPKSNKLKDYIPLINNVEPLKMYNALNDTIAARYKSLKNYKIYGKGWEKNRVKYNPYVIENERTKQAMKNKAIREQVNKAFDPNNMSFTDMLFKDSPSSTMVKIR